MGRQASGSAEEPAPAEAAVEVVVVVVVRVRELVVVRELVLARRAEGQRGGDIGSLKAALERAPMGLGWRWHG